MSNVEEQMTPMSELKVKTPVRGHERQTSDLSHNYSVIDIYHSPSPLPDHERQSIITTGSIPMTEPEGSNRSSSTVMSSFASAGSVTKSHFDRYGFKKGNLDNYNQWYQEYTKYEQTNMKKWKDLLENNGLNTNGVPDRFPPKSDKVKKLIRRGIPYEWRGNAWFFYAGGYEKLNKHIGVYEQIVRDTSRVQNKDTEVIERDLYRTFPDNIYFNQSLMSSITGSGYASSISTSMNITSPRPERMDQRSNLIQSNENYIEDAEISINLTNPKSTSSSKSTTAATLITPGLDIEPEMIQSLRRILVAFAHYNPQIGYCQSLNFLAGLLLLFMSEERAFWMLVVLTERIIPKVHSRDLEGVHVDQGVLMLCIKEYIPELWKIIGRNFEGKKITSDKILSRLPPVTLVTSSWFMSLFVGNLPIETVLRVWDILWYEGSKSLFRISLTICRMCLEHEEEKKRQAANKGAGAGAGAAAARGESDQIEYIQFMQNFPKKILDPNTLIDKCFKKIGGYGYGSLSQDEINQCREFVSRQRAILDKKHRAITPEMSENERRALQEDIVGHDVYGFHHSIMNGMVWNKNISNRMKKRFGKK